jgi:hypothetical protein
MRINFNTFVSTYVAVILFISIAACSPNSSATTGNSPPAKVVREDGRSKKALDCRDPNEYKFVVVENLDRRTDSDPTTPKDLHIIVGNAVSKIELPKADSEVKNFLLKSAEKTESGFEVKVDWGGDLDHYEVQFSFMCKENNFYLYEVRNDNFSTTNPKSGNLLDKKESRVNKIEPNVPIEKFVMTDYL